MDCVVTHDIHLRCLGGNACEEAMKGIGLGHAIDTIASENLSWCRNVIPQPEIDAIATAMSGVECIEIDPYVLGTPGYGDGYGSGGNGDGDGGYGTPGYGYGSGGGYGDGYGGGSGYGDAYGSGSGYGDAYGYGGGVDVGYGDGYGGGEGYGDARDM